MCPYFTKKSIIIFSLKIQFPIYKIHVPYFFVCIWYIMFWILALKTTFLKLSYFLFEGLIL